MNVAKATYSCDLAYRLRQRVVLQKPATPTDGETTPTYSDVVTLRAEVMPLRGTEQSRRDQMEAILAWRVIIRYRAGIGPDWRFTWGSRTLNITTAYDPEQRGRLLVCECKEIPT